ncbi:MAG: hypothetical protein ISS47_06580 [Candidatus Omnitrophica bacterium]|nr:hypothetical protein [Candidatus Omnitrophota bacterium]
MKKIYPSPYCLFNYQQVIELCKTFGIPMTLRTMNYYKSLHLIARPVPRRENPKGERKGYYPHWTVTNIIVIHFLQHSCSQTLRNIKAFKDNIMGKHADNKYDISSLWFFVELIEIYDVFYKKLFSSSLPFSLSTFLINGAFIEAVKKLGIGYLKSLRPLIDEKKIKPLRNKLGDRIAKNVAYAIWQAEGKQQAIYRKREV